jgi:FkbM family methyltransferase
MSASAQPDEPRAATVIVPARNAAAAIATQLEALTRQHDAPPFEVIVVANQCSDDTAEVAARFGDRLELRIVIADEHGSVAHARNQGAAAAQTPILLFCDADDLVDRHWVAGMVEAFTVHRADVAAGVVHVDRSDLRDWIYRWRYQHLDGTAVHEKPGRLPYGIGATLGVTRAAHRAIGGFDERFSGAAAEDVDFQNRLLRNGYRIAAAPKAHITYTPRLSVRGNVDHAKAYLRGELTLQAKEGRFRRQPLHIGLGHAVRTAAFQVIRKRNLNPVALYALTRERIDRAVLLSRPLPDGHPRQQQPQRDFAAPIGTPIIGGLAFEATTPGEASWYGQSGIEIEALSVVEQLLRPGGTFVDVGANIGVFTIAAALAVGPTGRVIAFEPAGPTRAMLERNIARHQTAPPVTVRPHAIGARRSTKKFLRYENSLVSGLGTAPALYSPGRLVSAESVDVVALDDTISGPVDLLKIDIEGFEADALAGARHLMSTNPDMSILLEVNPTSLELAGNTVDGILTHFPPESWDLRLLDAAGPRPASTEDVRDVIHRSPPGWYATLLATPR